MQYLGIAHIFSVIAAKAVIIKIAGGESVQKEKECFSVKNAKRIIALVLAAVLCLTLFAACGKGGANSKPLVVSSAHFENKFSPFFAASAEDMHIV